MRILLVLGSILFLSAVAQAQAQDSDEGDCADAQTQQAMNECAEQDYADADKELNAQYSETKSAMDELDETLSEDLAGAGKALLKSQRAWLAYRDAQCGLAGFTARGGSMEPMLVSSCLADLTQTRTQQLRELSEGQ